MVSVVLSLVRYYYQTSAPLATILLFDARTFLSGVNYTGPTTTV